MKKIFINFIYQSLFQLLVIAMPLITIPIVSRALGAEGIGFYGFTNSIVNYFLLLAGFGMASYAVREIAYVRNDRDKLSEKFWELQLFNTFFSAVVFFVYVIFFWLTNQHYLYLIQSLLILSVFFDISWLFQAMENFKQIAVRRAIVKILSVLCIVTFVRDQGDLWIYALLLSSSQLISSLILWSPAFKYVYFKKVTFKAIWSHFRPSLNFLVLKISATVFVSINKTLLGLMSTVVMVGYFTNSLLLITTLGAIIGALNQIMFPRMSSLQKIGNEKKLVEILQKTIHIQLFFTVAMMFGIIAINAQLISWFFGEDFYFVNNLIPILAPILIFRQLHQAIADQFLVTKNEMKLYNGTMLLGTLVNVIVSFIAIPFIHGYGAALGFVLGQVCLAISRSVILVKKSSFRFNWSNILKWLFSGVVMLLIVWMITKNMSATIFTTVVQGFIGFIAYMLLTFILKANLVLEVVKKWER